MEQLFEHKKTPVPRVCLGGWARVVALTFRTVTFSAQNRNVI
jgi:hypothetical protein